MHPFCVKPISQLSAFPEDDPSHGSPEFKACCRRSTAGRGCRFLSVTLQTVQALTCSEAFALLWVHTLQQLGTSLGTSLHAAWHTSPHRFGWRGAKHIPLLQLRLQMRAVPPRALWHQPLNVHCSGGRLRSCVWRFWIGLATRKLSQRLYIEDDLSLLEPCFHFM